MLSPKSPRHTSWPLQLARMLLFLALKGKSLRERRVSWTDIWLLLRRESYTFPESC